MGRTALGRQAVLVWAVWTAVGLSGTSSLAETLPEGKSLSLRPADPSQETTGQPQHGLTYAELRPPELRRRPELAAPARTKPLLIPLPAFSSDPDQGSEFGLLPVWLFFDETGDVRNILAPSAIFNTDTGLKWAFRWLGWLPNGGKYRLIANRSLFVDEDYTADIEVPRLGAGGHWALAAGVRYFRDPTFRFFGFGPKSREQDESSLTQREVRGFFSVGINFLRFWRLSYNERARQVAVKGGGRTGDPFTGEAFPDTPGVKGETTISARGLSLDFDTRDIPDLPTRGFYGRVAVEVSQTAWGSEVSFTRFSLEAKGFIPWPSDQWISAIRFLTDFVDTRGLPFFEQSRLGGRDFRGFPRHRFTDRGRFMVNVEERVRALRLEILRIPVDLEAAPFVEVGQVFDSEDDFALRDIQVGYGMGFRAVVRPNVVGKVDIGVSDEGLNIFVGLDYPF